jgi:hypothetical protein
MVTIHLLGMSLRAEGEAISTTEVGDCFGLCPRSDMRDKVNSYG